MAVVQHVELNLIILEQVDQLLLLMFVVQPEEMDLETFLKNVMIVIYRTMMAEAAHEQLR